MANQRQNKIDRYKEQKKTLQEIKELQVYIEKDHVEEEVQVIKGFYDIWSFLIKSETCEIGNLHKLKPRGSPVLILLTITGYNEDNSPKNLNDKNQQASSQKFRQLIFFR